MNHKQDCKCTFCINHSQKYNIDLNEVVRLHEAGQSFDKIAEKYGCCGSTLVFRLRKNGIKLKKIYNSWNKGLKAEDDIRIKLSTDKCKIVNTGRTPWNKGKSFNLIDIPSDTLLDLYVTQNKTLNDCANVFKVCGHTIRYRLEELGVAIRPMKGKTHALYGKPVSDERRKKISITLGGTGELVDKARYVGFTDELRESIRKRDNYCCNECGFTNEEHLVAYKLSLPVHHIDYDKENSTEDNLITLCGFCHSKTNINRDYWQPYFEKKMKDLTESFLNDRAT